MPAFSVVTLDRLLEPGASKSADKSAPPSANPVPKPKPPSRSTLHRRNSTSITDRSPHRPQLIPSLYTTPEATPVPPDSPKSYTASPYIINHKRRGPRLSKSTSVGNLASQKKALDKDEVDGGSKGVETHVNVIRDDQPADLGRESPKQEDLRNGIHRLTTKAEPINGHHDGAKVGSNGKVAVSDLRYAFLKEKDGTSARDSDIEDFFDPRESMSLSSTTDGEDNFGTSSKLSASTYMTEFFDAWEELSSESGSQSALHDFQTELRETRFSLLMEIEKRKQSEDALKNVQSQWQRIREQLALAGLSVPPCPIDLTENDEPISADPAEELCQQLDIIRFVSNSIGGGIARAETEVEMEARIEAKNFEIARLMDRLRYYEAVNHEMSTRNQESVEMARRNRQMQKRRQRWVWCSIAAAITLGSTALAWSYLPLREGSASAPASSSSETEHNITASE